MNNDTVYLMKAHHINEGRNASLSAIIKSQNGRPCTILCTITHKGTKRFCISSGNATDYKVQDEFTWINDTGRGYRYPSFSDQWMTIQNIIKLDTAGAISKVNDIGMIGSRPTQVFK